MRNRALISYLINEYLVLLSAQPSNRMELWHYGVDNHRATTPPIGV